MLNAETKRHIDAARDVLVGVAPNPMTQIDQITYALVYKFMDDMDQAAIKAGGEPSFFTGELEAFAWSKLVDTRMGNQEKMNLYGEALQRFAEAKQLPELFRTIFRAAFLPYRSPETLGLFLKEINFFDYTHPEELGNAYEYLLSIMSAQGDAGQFRTPRHIIDFIVDVINPTKDDTVLDPACGTGGFLVASYNHILEQHDGKNDPSKHEKPLTPDERRKLMNNFEGYDIDPSMVRIAQVNMYLHQFKNPKIVQYDSLTSEERWNDKFDVILANPPFMSPKGGIKPHNKFALQSNRSEVLFVDYIANHLKPNGRAAIIVPEGIVSHVSKTYSVLRRALVNSSIHAVVSLPAGVFQPYSAVKTSILFLDKSLAERREEVLFIEVKNDGFELGSTKRAIPLNDLPFVASLLSKWIKGEAFESKMAHRVKKSKLLENQTIALIPERYEEKRIEENVKYPRKRLGDVVVAKAGNNKLIKGKQSDSPRENLFPAYSASGQDVWVREAEYEVDGVVVSAVGARCGKAFLAQGKWTAVANTHVLIPTEEIDAKFLWLLVNDESFWVKGGTAQPFVKVRESLDIHIPVPSIDEQRAILEEIAHLESEILRSKQVIADTSKEINTIRQKFWM
jgi:type I restriction enzyme M protein